MLASAESHDSFARDRYRVIAPLRLDEGLDATCVSDTFKAMGGDLASASTMQSWPPAIEVNLPLTSQCGYGANRFMAFLKLLFGHAAGRTSVTSCNACSPLMASRSAP